MGYRPLLAPELQGPPPGKTNDFGRAATRPGTRNLGFVERKEVNMRVVQAVVVQRCYPRSLPACERFRERLHQMPVLVAIGLNRKRNNEALHDTPVLPRHLLPRPSKFHQARATLPVFVDPARNHCGARPAGIEKTRPRLSHRSWGVHANDRMRKAVDCHRTLAGNALGISLKCALTYRFQFSFLYLGDLPSPAWKRMRKGPSLRRQSHYTNRKIVRMEWRDTAAPY